MTGPWVVMRQMNAFMFFLAAPKPSQKLHHGSIPQNRGCRHYRNRWTRLRGKPIARGLAPACPGGGDGRCSPPPGEGSWYGGRLRCGIEAIYGQSERQLFKTPGRVFVPGNRAAGARLLRGEPRGGQTPDPLRHRRCHRTPAAGGDRGAAPRRGRNGRARNLQGLRPGTGLRMAADGHRPK